MANEKNSKNRRQFLKNVSLGTLGLSLSPLLGKAKSAENTNFQRKDACDATTLDYYGEGPFYTANPPIISDNQLAKNTEPGTKIRISGRVLNKDCTEHIPNATIDVWHANDAGDYDNSGFNLRGKVQSNSEGFYLFETVKPGKYLNGTKYRPSHIHFKIRASGFGALTTQLYFSGDTSIAEDAAASITSGQFDATHRIINLVDDGNGMLEGTWDIVIDAKGVNGINDLHLNNGMIYEASPNPFREQLTIKYGVFRPAETSLLVFDMQGRQVALLEKTMLKPEKYEATWVPNTKLQNGHYFIALKLNDIQVHYLKVHLNRG
jgi:protocatechuate 3,4-dioxygenase beta subunit